MGKVCGRFHVRGDAALVAIHRCKVFAVACLVGLVNRWPDPHAIPTVGPLNFHNVGTKISKQRPRKGARSNLTKFKNTQPLQRA